MHPAIVAGVASCFFSSNVDETFGDSIPWCERVYRGRGIPTTMTEAIPAGAIVWIAVAVCSYLFTADV
jgi:hypothetical protein